MNNVSPLGNQRVQGAGKIPETELLAKEYTGPLDVRASAKSHPRHLKNEPILSSEAVDAKTILTPEPAISIKEMKALNKEAKRFGESIKSQREGVVATVLGAIPDIVEQAVDGLHSLFKKLDILPKVQEGLSIAGAALSLILTPIKMAKAWAKWGDIKDTQKSLESPPINEAQKKHFVDGLKKMLLDPQTSVDQVKDFLKKEGISLEKMNIVLGGRESHAFAKFKKNAIGDTAFQNSLWDQHKNSRGDLWRSRFLSNLNLSGATLEAGRLELAKIGVNIPDWREVLKERIKSSSMANEEKGKAFAAVKSCQEKNLSFQETADALSSFQVPLHSLVTTKEELRDKILSDPEFISKMDSALSDYEGRVFKMEEMLNQRRAVEEGKMASMEEPFAKKLQEGINSFKRILRPETQNRAERMKAILSGIKEMGLSNLDSHIEERIKRLEVASEKNSEQIQSLKNVQEILRNPPVEWEKIDSALVAKSAESLAGVLADPQGFQAMLKDHVRHEETLSASLRNGMKAMSEAKLQREKQFYRFTLTESTIMGAFTILTSAVTIAGFIMTCTGILTIPGIFLTGLGLAGVGLSVVSMGSGWLHSIMTAPNRLKEETFHLRSIRQTIRSIPFGYKKYMFERELLKDKKNKIAIGAISAKLGEGIPPELLKQLRPNLLPGTYRLLRKEKLSEAEARVLEERLKGHREKALELDDQLKKLRFEYLARQEDYQYHRTKLSEAGMKDLARGMTQAEMMFSPSNPEKPGLLDALMQIHKPKDNRFETGMDEQTVEALKKYTGVDPAGLTQKARDELVSSRVLFRDELTAFYGATLDDMLEGILPKK
ncbi:hypothetical protein [Estrella lausannensis]|uniref:Putative membrane protein n=1 Tax=Estrella lausannensis TaxID=483423 RepID=A0A0H5DN39_9BACT|nr:hypothetical protein [Estrella lausannensis]CRX37651.1 putative membrane protein [Estrella lausannensis]